MAAGVMAGAIIARIYGIGHPIIFCGLTGLLFSLHVYRRCVCVLIDEYRRLKSKHRYRRLERTTAISDY